MKTELIQLNKNGQIIPKQTIIYSNPKHIKKIVSILKNNTSIQRFTAVNIISYLFPDEEIPGEKHSVKFLLDRFVVKCNNVTKAYAYTETFFLNCFISSFNSFFADSKSSIDNFILKEKLDVLYREVNTKKICTVLKVSADSILFFDMDGTLVDTDYANFLSYKKAIDSVVNPNCNLQYNPKNRFTRNTLEKIFPNLSKSDYTKIVNLKEKYYPQFLSETNLNKEVFDILIKYSATHKTVLVTNCCKERAIATLSYYGLEDKFDEFIFKNKEQNLNKYQYAFSKLKITPNLVIAFEDEEQEKINASKEGIKKIINVKKI